MTFTGEVTYEPRYKDLATLMREPLPFQWTGIRTMVDCLRSDSSQGFLLGDEMGLGKSIQAIYTVASLGERALVMCPAGVIFNWVTEIFSTHPDWTVCVYGDKTPTRRLKGLFGKDHSRFTIFPDKADVIVMSYDAAKRCVCGNPDPVSVIKPTHKMVCLPHHAKFFEDRVFVGDELHLCKNPGAARTQAGLAIARACKYAIALTGTAIANKPHDLWTLLAAVNIDGALVGSHRDFQKIISQGKWESMHKGLLDSGRYLRRLKKDVLTEIPPKIRQDWILEMTQRQQMEYESLRTVLKRKAKISGSTRSTCMLAILSRMQTLANSVKVDPVAERCAERAAEGYKTLVVSGRTDPLWDIRDTLLDQGIVAEVMDGGTAKIDRKRICDQFNDGPIQVVLTTLAEGVNLIGTDMVIMLDCDWTYSKVCQREDRAHRKGQFKSVQIVRVISADIDRKKIDVVCGKKLVTHAVLDGGDTSDAMDSVMEAVITALCDEDDDEEAA